MDNKKKEIFKYIGTCILIYFLLVIAFGLIYFLTQSIRYSTDNKIEVSFFDSCYFSFISFVTIGYGDIFPIDGLGKFILFLETIAAMIFSSIFSSFLIIKVLKRPQDLIVSDNIYLTKVNENYFLFIRVGNKGNDIINCQIKLDIFKWESNLRRIDCFYEKSYHILEENVWIFKIKLNDEKNIKILNKIKNVLQKKENLKLRVSFYGIDSETNSHLAFIKYYTESNLKYSNSFQNVMQWQKEKVTQKDWNNFQEYTDLSDSFIQEFISH